MISGFRNMAYGNAQLNNPDMIAKYASLGYFHYKYIKSLRPLNLCENIVKDNGTVVRNPGMQNDEKYLIRLSIADFTNKRKITAIFAHNLNKSNITVGQLINIIQYIHHSSHIDDANCFIKFDFYTIADS